jgi:hypothetical protein
VSLILPFTAPTVVVHFRAFPGRHERKMPSPKKSEVYWMKKTTVAFLVVVALVSGTVIGRGFKEYNVYGSGTISCGQWRTDSTDGAMRRFEISWILGFVTGVGYAAVAPLKTSDAEGMVRWVDQYCDANPLKDLSDAAGKLVHELNQQSH